MNERTQELKIIEKGLMSDILNKDKEFKNIKEHLAIKSMTNFTVSIGICAYNEEKNIGRLLDRLLKEKKLYTLKEIIVVASGCTDGTEGIVKQYTSKCEKINLIVERGRKGKASAINIILKEAVGDIIVFVDGDDLPAKNSICKLIKPIEKNNVSATTGRMIPKKNGQKLIYFFNSLIWRLHHRVSLNQPKISGQFFAIKRNLIKKIYSKAVCDDAFITGILRGKNINIGYVPKAIVYIETPSNIIRLLKQRKRIAIGYTQLRLNGLDVTFSFDQKIKALIEEIIKSPRNVYKIILIVFLEIIANLLAFFDIVRGNIPYCWEK